MKCQTYKESKFQMSKPQMIETYIQGRNPKAQTSNDQNLHVRLKPKCWNLKWPELVCKVETQMLKP